MQNVKSFEDFLNIYNAYQLYMASQGEPKPEPKPEPKAEPKPEPNPEPKTDPKTDDTTPAWARDLLDRMDKLEKRQPGVSIEKIDPVGLEDVIKKML